MDQNLLKQVTLKANSWLAMRNMSAQAKFEIRRMLAGDGAELVDAFYRDLEFGTGGLRGVMGVGSNRMNVYTVAMATQGLANYLKLQRAGGDISVAIARDSRANGEDFARVAANVLSANGIKVHLFLEPRPTPQLSFAIRYLRCQSGIVITASHNPKEYNGYKAYWEDGAQIISPHDKNIIAEVQKVTNIDAIDMRGNPRLVEEIAGYGDNAIDRAYLEAVKSLSMSPEAIAAHGDIKIVYTPLHGAGSRPVPASLANLGFTDVSVVAEQQRHDGAFPTVESPNPEEPAAMRMAMEQARALGADIVMATDPDADRVGIGLRDPKGEYILLNGNQAAAVLVYYLLTKWKEAGRITGNEFIVKTIVTTDLLADIAAARGVECHEVLTGFKYIADKIRSLEGQKRFIVGGEESYGYLAGDFVRDKDAVVACSLFAEIAAWARSRGETLHDILMRVYREHGLYRERLVSITKKGKEGVDQIAAMMRRLRAEPPAALGGAKVVTVRDYMPLLETDTATGRTRPILLPKSDVLQFVTADGVKVSARPSGTEPKIKFYFGAKGALSGPGTLEADMAALDAKIDRVVADLGI